MKQRCSNPRDKSYADYGGRGIKVCDRWRSFENFLADMGERPGGKTLDRIDNDKGYEPGNCKWATSKEQQRNKRNNHLVTGRGKTQAISAWAEELGLDYDKLKWRFNTRNFEAAVSMGEDDGEAIREEVLEVDGSGPGTGGDG